MTANYKEVSEARKALRDSYQNLQNVADYCEKNYMEAPDKRKALQSTMALVTQTLACVTSQVGIAARHMSIMLEEQSQILQKEEAKVRFISLLLDFHAEKVSRRKIGSLTISKKFPLTEKIVYGETNGPLASYTRHPINLNSLDHCGHGISDNDTQQLSKTGTMSHRISGKSVNQSSLGKSCRIKDPVLPPLVPAMTACPLTPRVPTSPGELGDFLLPPPPAALSDSTRAERQNIAEGSHFIDPPPPNHNGFPPPLDPSTKSSWGLPPPAIKGSHLPDPPPPNHNGFPPPLDSGTNPSWRLPPPAIKDSDLPDPSPVNLAHFPPPSHPNTSALSWQLPPPATEDCDLPDPSPPNLTHFPPPSDPGTSAPSWELPPPAIKDFRTMPCISTVNVEDPLPPPPPLVDAAEDSFWPQQDELQFLSMYEQYLEGFLTDPPSPPPPSLDMIHPY